MTDTLSNQESQAQSRRALLSRPRTIARAALVLLAIALLWGTLGGESLFLGSDRIAINDLKRVRTGEQVELHGVVTFADPRAKIFYFQDATWGMQVEMNAPLPRAGERIEVRANIKSEYQERFGMRSIRLSNVKVVSKRAGKLPAAEAITITDLQRMSARREGSRVQTSGVVRAARLNGERLTLELGDSGQHMSVMVLQSDSIDAQRLIDARVTVRGALQLGIDRIAESFAPHLWVASPEDLELTDEPPAQPAAVSLRTMLDEPAWLARGHRVRVQGRVIRADGPDRLLVDSEGLLVPVETTGAHRFNEGDSVEAIGWPTKQRWNIVLARSSVSRIAAATDRTVLNPRDPLTQVGQVRALTSAEAAKNHTVQVVGTITSILYEFEFLFVQTGETGIFVDAWGQSLADLEPGMRVRITGVTAPGEFAPVIAQPWLQVLEMSSFPEAQQVDSDLAPTGAYDSKWVELEGLVRPFVPAIGTYEFNLDTAIGTVGGILIEPGDATQLDALVDARVKVKGVLGTSFTSKGVLTGYRLFVHSPEHIEVVRKAPTHAARDTPHRIGELLRFSGGSETARRVLVRGTVTLRSPGHVYIQDGTGSLRIDAGDAEVEAGDVVEASGYPSPSEQGPTMNDATVRTTGQIASVIPVSVDAAQVLQGSFDNRLVRMEARVLSQSSSNAQQTLVLQSGFSIFNAELESTVPLPQWREGSIVEVTGICAVQRSRRVDRFRGDFNAKPESFRLMMRTAEDAKLLRAVPWWSLRQAWPTMAMLMLAILLAMLWARALRRRVAQQTGEIEYQSGFLRQVIDLCPDRIFVRDRAGRFTLVNRALAEEHGSTPEALIGKSDLDLGVPTTQAQAALAEDREVLESGREKTIGEHSRTAIDGRQLWLHTVKRPLLDERGVPSHVLGLSNDITAHKEAEKILQDARMAAESANRAKSEFLANMSHEIRTPLNGIIGMSELCLDTELSAEQREYVQALKSSGDGLLTVVNDILDFSKIEAGKLQLEARTFDLREALDAVMKMLALQAHRKGLELLCEVALDVPRAVRGDVTRLRQVLINLIGNAIRSTDCGEVLVGVALDARDDNSCTIRFTIADTACGANADRQPLIFNPFESSDAVGARQYCGAELGMTISNRLVALMDGRVWLDSDGGRGSLIHFTARFGTLAAQLPENAMPTQLRDKRVLVVDDNASSRRILNEQLLHLGLRPLTASSASEALERLAECARAGDVCQIVIADMEMPVVDGLALFERVRGRGFAVGFIMLLSSHGLRQNTMRCQTAGVLSHLTKPVRFGELRDVLSRALTQKEARTPSARVSDPLPADVRGLNVLVAEDNTVNQMVVQRLLQKRGHRVTIAGSGKVALDAFRAERFDLILMDVQMPELDGLEATRQIRQCEAEGGQNRIPIVALTAHAMSGDRERCLASGMDGYITKPVSPRELDEVLEKYGDTRDTRAAV